ncbi:MAG TPA: hypothetical protein VKA48_03940 [Gammaproteobacteria bacterium]|nr:hypothetical protein [Gammaproteobacteria bacterium]
MTRSPFSLILLAFRCRRLAPLVAMVWIAGWLAGTPAAWSAAWGHGHEAHTHSHIPPHPHSSPELAHKPHQHIGSEADFHPGQADHGHGSPEHLMASAAMAAVKGPGDAPLLLAGSGPSEPPDSRLNLPQATGWPAGLAPGAPKSVPRYLLIEHLLI